MTKEDILHHFQDINFYYNDCMMYDDLSRMLDELIAENKEEEIKMDKLKELEKRMDRIMVLMDASRMSIEELLASAAEKEVTNCEKCPLLKSCDNHDNDGCYMTWLKFLEEGRIE